MPALEEAAYKLKNEDETASPQLLYDLDIIERNIERMIAMAGGTERLWPHIKTHKSRNMLELLMGKGIRRFKAATIAEAELAGMCGAGKVLLAYPLTGPNIGRFVRLIKAFPNTDFFAIGDDLDQIALLSDRAVKEGVFIQLLLDINTGLNRTGVSTVRAGALYRKAGQLPGIRMRGMHVYDGQRHEADLLERQFLVDRDLAEVYQVRDHLTHDGLPCDILVMGGTPSFPCYAKYKDVFLSPGTCIVEDYGYASAFPDLPFEIAAVLLTRVVSHPISGYFTVDLGYKAVAADPAVPRAVIIGYEDAETVMQNEEHWVLRMPAGEEKRTPPIGKALYAAPKHICPTSALYPSALIISEGCVVDEWEITARNRRITI